jgi:hypothetical protein
MQECRSRLCSFILPSPPLPACPMLVRRGAWSDVWHNILLGRVEWAAAATQGVGAASAAIPAHTHVHTKRCAHTPHRSEAQQYLRFNYVSMREGQFCIFMAWQVTNAVVVLPCSKNMSTRWQANPQLLMILASYPRIAEDNRIKGNLNFCYVDNTLR